MNIFLSVPFTSKVDMHNNVLPGYRRHIEQLLTGLRERGHQVFSALEHEGWRMEDTANAAQEFQHDFTQIDQADKLIVLLEDRISAGVQIELGYAYAKGKQLDMYQVGRAAWSNVAFACVAGRELRPVKDIDDLVQLVLEGDAGARKG